MAHNILLIEDEHDLATLIAYHLQPMMHTIKHLDKGLQVFEMFDQQNWDLVLLDLRMPDSDGIEICSQLRELYPDLPIIIISARNSSMEIIEGFNAGADDYITKPFEVIELVARVKAILRRLSPNEKNGLKRNLVFDELEIDPKNHIVYVSGHPIQLTRKEFHLLTHFANSPGQIFNRDELLNEVWGNNYDGYAHTVNSHINRLRQKIEPDPKAPRFIQTVWGVGYRLVC